MCVSRQMVIEKLTDELDALLSVYHVIILPVVNVDGYEYTWTQVRTWAIFEMDVVSLVCTN